MGVMTAKCTLTQHGRSVKYSLDVEITKGMVFIVSTFVKFTGSILEKTTGGYRIYHGETEIETETDRRVEGETDAGIDGRTDRQRQA